MKTPKNQKKPYIVLQIEPAECAAASLAMILGYYGRYIEMKQLRAECNVSRDGTDLPSLLKAAQMHAMESKLTEPDATLAAVQLPCIVFWNYSHYLVVLSKTNTDYTLLDPACGKVRVSAAEFERQYSGVAIELTPGPDFKPCGKPHRSIDDILGIAASYRMPLVFLGITAVLINLIGLLIPILVQLLTDRYRAITGTGMFRSYVGVFAGLVLVQLLLAVLQNHFLQRFELRVSETINADLVRKCLTLPLVYFDRRNSATLVYQLGSSDMLCSFVASELVTMLMNFAFALVYLILLFTYNAGLALVILLIIIVISVAMLRLMRAGENQAQSNINEGRSFFSALIYSISLFDTIKATAEEDKYFNRLAASYGTYLRTALDSMTISNAMTSISTTAPLMFQLTVFTLGSLQVMNGHMTIGGLLACQSLTMSLYSPVARIISQASELQLLNPRARDMHDIETEESDPLVTNDIRDDAGDILAGQIEFQHVTFGYNKAIKPIISDINFRVEPGKTIAIVGGSGSGKSTILKLLEGLYLPDSGTILYDGNAMTEISHARRAASCAVVSQTPFLFDGTVRENMTHFDNSVRDVDLVRAAQDACISEDILAMPDGYESVVSGEGAGLSGGQRQRLVIAQALVRNPSILILDEATSALDTLTEQMLMENIKRRKITTIIVAHRLSTIRDADEIIVLKDGGIAERGTHEELIALEDGLYHALVTAEGGSHE